MENTNLAPQKAHLARHFLCDYLHYGHRYTPSGRRDDLWPSDEYRLAMLLELCWGGCWYVVLSSCRVIFLILILVAIIVSCVASLRQLFVVSQNQSSSARAAYNDTNEPILKRSKEGYSQDLARSTGDIEAPANDEVPMSPLSVVHVRQEFEVTSVDASQSANGDKTCRHQTSFD